MRFKSLSLKDFIEESKEWSKEDFLPNVVLHGTELKNLDVDNKDSIYWGCRESVWDLIDFLRKVVNFKQHEVYPIGMTEDNFRIMIDILNRYRSEDDKYNPEMWI